MKGDALENGHKSSRQLFESAGGKRMSAGENKNSKILATLREERAMRLKGGLYHQTQIKLAFNSNRIEGSKLSEEQTRYDIIMFKECLKNEIMPFIIDHQHKQFYYRGLREFRTEKGYLTDTCRSAQDSYERMTAYFIRILFQEESH
jgi:uncharacterized protein YaaR (DUF327 family)